MKEAPLICPSHAVAFAPEHDVEAGIAAFWRQQSFLLTTHEVAAAELPPGTIKSRLLHARAICIAS